jgi:hypothetical protein
MTLAALIVAASALAATDAASTPASPCFGYGYADARGDASLDAVRYGLEYNCHSDRWTAWVQTASQLPAGRLGRFELDLDTDWNLSSGCGGVDWQIDAAYIPTIGNVGARAVHFTSGCSRPATETLPMQAIADQGRGTSTVEVSFDGGPLTFDRARGFRWWARLVDAASGSTDRMPDGTATHAYVPTGSTAFVDRAAPPIHGVGIVVAGDFNGDHRADVLQYRPGSLPDAIWYSDPAKLGFRRVAVNIPGVFDQIVSGDFNGDGRSDILFYAPGARASAMWTARAGGGFAARNLTIPGPRAQLIVGDFNGDGRADVLVYRPAPAPSAVLYAEPNGTFNARSVVINGAYSQIVAGDFDGDGRSDLLFYRPGAPDTMWHGQSDGSFTPTPITIAGNYDQLVAGDFNADGRTDVLLYGHGTAPDGLLKGTSTAPYLVASGERVAINETYASVIAGDFDGNGTADLLFTNWSSDADRWWASTL